VRHVTQTQTAIGNASGEARRDQWTDRVAHEYPDWLNPTRPPPAITPRLPTVDIRIENKLKVRSRLSDGVESRIVKLDPIRQETSLIQVESGVTNRQAEYHCTDE
jgi:hypothetical protein